MTISYQKEQNTVCPACGASFVMRNWLIVDYSERPDLIKIEQSNRLHKFSCPNCSETLQSEAPLLIYWTDISPPLLFSPSESASKGQSERHAEQLVVLLAKSLGSAWRDEWLEEGVALTPRYCMPLLLRQPPHLVPFCLSILEFNQIAEWEAVGQFVHTHPELLEDTTQELYGVMIQYLKDIGMPERVPDLNDDRKLLLRMREVGILTALDENRFRPAGEFQELVDQAEHAENRYMSRKNPADLEKALQGWKEILSSSGFNAAEVDFRTHVYNSLAVNLLRRYQEFNQTPDLREVENLLEKGLSEASPNSPDLSALHNNLAVARKAQFAIEQNSAYLEQAIFAARQAISRARAEDKEKATYWRTLADCLTERYKLTSSANDLDEAVAAYQDAVRLSGDNSRSLPELLTNLGNRLIWRFHSRGDRQDLDTALVVWEQAVQYTAQDAPELPNRLNNLANGYRRFYTITGGNVDYLRRAEKFHKAALRLTPHDSPARPSYLNNLANTYFANFEHDGYESDLQNALACWKEEFRDWSSGRIDHKSWPVSITILATGCAWFSKSMGIATYWR